ncbi:MAG: glutaredoxin family protein [Pseudohongiellaceae bacterium]
MTRIQEISDGRHLVLYTTAGCHLCEQAAAILAELEARNLVIVTAVDIASDEELVERYGIRIPVVRNEARGEEIGWPFSSEDLLSLVS